MINEQEDVKRVLVVEDEPGFAALITSILDRQGYDVTLASNGDEALQKVTEEAPDLITLDFQMPGRAACISAAR